MKPANPQIAAWVMPETILLDADARNRAVVLDLIASAIARTHGLEAAPILRALERREQASSTGLGDGFALPHARIDGLDKPLTLFLRARSAIAFGAPDHRPVRDFFAILVPAGGDRQLHLDLLAAVASLFAVPTLRHALDEAEGVDAATALFSDAVARLTSER